MISLYFHNRNDGSVTAGHGACDELTSFLTAGPLLLHATSAAPLLPATTPLPPTLAPLPSGTPPLLVGVVRPLPPTIGALQQRPPPPRLTALGVPDHLRPPMTPPRPTADPTDRVPAGTTPGAASGVVVIETGVRLPRSEDMNAEMVSLSSSTLFVLFFSVIYFSPHCAVSL